MDYNKEYLRMTEVQLREFMEILDIEQDITREDLKKAYKLRINENHPDKGGDDETAK
uniref:J domain-containing protein n=1 Tax=Acrobeloides nanus TaxID=290746 RepID=A0A914ENL1_9BILA